MMKKHILTTIFLLISVHILAVEKRVQFGQGYIITNTIADNAVRIRYVEGKALEALPEMVYVNQQDVDSEQISVRIDNGRNLLEVRNAANDVVFIATSHSLSKSNSSELMPYKATLSFTSGNEAGVEEFQYGLGQFQDGFANVRGITRRLTQVNTQISVPMLISNKGYGILWNNYGLTDFNPADKSIRLEKDTVVGKAVEVNATSTTGNKREIRRNNLFTAELNIEESGNYSILLDVGQKMARRHHLKIDDNVVIDMSNTWLPPTASQTVFLSKGTHMLTAELTGFDNPVLYYKKVQEGVTVFQSPAAQAVDYTVFTGTPDEIISTYRKLTGEAPLMPKWMLGYIHCRERFHSQDELLGIASRFRDEHIPADVMVQDWQYWGKYGWNAMQFDEQYYPNPKLLTDSLHAINQHLMLSVWSKITKNSEVGKAMDSKGYYIPDTEWIDFFNPDAAKAYWSHFSKRLLPLGIDAWWQDATEPENDDLQGRMVGNGKYHGDDFRNIYPLLVSKTVAEGLLDDQPTLRPVILTRCGFTGIQRYGSAMWSGDVGNDWETLRRQITAGIGLQAAGVPWWTYDAGGFFRPGNQYTDQAYIKRMLRWVETSVFLPLMRVHGYQSNTEPWEYGNEAKSIFTDCIKERYKLLPYIYSNAAEVSFNGSTLMRPLVFDFTDDNKALGQRYEYMFGKALLVAPVVLPDVKEWITYLPENKAGWFDYITGKHYKGGESLTTTIDEAHIPVFVRGGSIVPYGQAVEYATEPTDGTMEIVVYPGANATFTLYEDDGCTNDYKDGKCSRITFSWDEKTSKLTISDRTGSFNGMAEKRVFNVKKVNGKAKKVKYKGKLTTKKL